MDSSIYALKYNVSDYSPVSKTSSDRCGEYQKTLKVFRRKKRRRNHKKNPISLRERRLSAPLSNLNGSNDAGRQFV